LSLIGVDSKKDNFLDSGIVSIDQRSLMSYRRAIEMACSSPRAKKLQGRQVPRQQVPSYPGVEIGTVKFALLSVGPVAGKYEGTILGLGIGYIGELSAGFTDAFTFIARSCKRPYVDRYDGKLPKEMSRSSIRPGHRARCSRPFVAGESGCRRQALAYAW